MAEYTHFVLCCGRNTMVKVADFFRDQGGTKDSWGRRWVPVVAESIKDARRIGSRLQQIPLHKNDKEQPLWPFTTVADLLARAETPKPGEGAWPTS